MIQQVITRRAPILAAIAMLPVLLPASTVSQRQLEVQKEGIRLVTQVEESAREIRYHADHLDALANSMQASRHIHKSHLTQIRESVNERLRPAMQRLVEIQGELPEWKQQSIQDMHADAAALAAHVNGAIVQANDGTLLQPAMNAEYKKLVSGVHEQAGSLVKRSDAVGTYSSALLKAQGAGVEVPQS
ncbi:MAG TPA: hypothetical protein VHC72_02630 [Bryobacteraceae bacterium]|nr:hypothetical protein [Bryobacteraceae bacterium]